MALLPGIHLSMTDKFKQKAARSDAPRPRCSQVVDEGFNPTYGARPLRRAIMRLVEDELAESFLKDPSLHCDRLWVVKHGEWVSQGQNLSKLALFNDISRPQSMNYAVQEPTREGEHILMDVNADGNVPETTLRPCPHTWMAPNLGHTSPLLQIVGI